MPHENIGYTLVGDGVGLSVGGGDLFEDKQEGSVSSKCEGDLRSTDSDSDTKIKSPDMNMGTNTHTQQPT